MAIGLLALIVVTRTLVDAARVPEIYNPIAVALALAAGASLVLGFLRPAPWLLALSLWAVLSVVWFYAIVRWVKYTSPEEQVPTLD